MTKSDIVGIVANNTGCTKSNVETVVSATIAALTEAMQNGEKVQFVGFGTFEVKDVAAREGRNPATGETISIPASKKPSFTASKALKDLING